MDTYNWEGKVILIAEDVHINYKLIELNLKKTNVETIWAKNGKVAVEICQSQHVDLVLMDIQMPVMNGYEATKQIRENKPELPIIAQTAFAMTNEKENSLRAGCNSYITKPIDKRELLALIDSYLKKD